MIQEKYREEELQTNLNELAQETIREWFLAAKKVSIYSIRHPLAQKAVNHAFIMMGKVFKYKKYFDIYLANGHLYALNIRIQRAKFNDQLIESIQALELKSILFHSDISEYEFQQFMERFVAKLPLSDHRNFMANYLKDRKIETISVNSTISEILYQNGVHLNGDIYDDFSVRSIVNQILGEDLEFLAYLLMNEYDDEEYIKNYKHDYHHALVEFLVPERISTVDTENLEMVITGKIVNVLDSRDTSADIDPDQLQEIKGIIRALDFHHKKEEILEKVGNKILEKGISKDIYSEFLPKTSSLKLESSEKIDNFLGTVFNQEMPGYDLDRFKDLFSRLLKTGQQSKSKAVINILLTHLAGNDLDMRKSAVVLFRYIISSISGLTDQYLVQHIFVRIEEYLSEGRETFEFSDLISELMKKLLQKKNYKDASGLCEILKSRVCQSDGVTSYDSVAVKKALEEMNRLDTIISLRNELTNHENRNQYAAIRNILVTIGSQEVAESLADIISHDSRIVRQNVLRILSELGKASLQVFSRFLANNNLFERDHYKRELHDSQWYIVRNSIFVLGSIRDPEACRSLRIRMNDPDTRIRREIIQALEKIRGNQAIDLLLLMADDDDYEIRDAAIIVLGMIGSSDIVPELVNIAEMRTSNVIGIINTVGKLGGIKSREFLKRILIDKDYISELASGRISKEDIKLASIKALGRIGDSDSIDTIKEFNESFSAPQKLLFGKKLNKAANDILNKRQ